VSDGCVRQPRTCGSVKLVPVCDMLSPSDRSNAPGCSREPPPRSPRPRPPPCDEPPPREDDIPAVHRAHRPRRRLSPRSSPRRGAANRSASGQRRVYTRVWVLVCSARGLLSTRSGLRRARGGRRTWVLSPPLTVRGLLSPAAACQHRDSACPPLPTEGGQELVKNRGMATRMAATRYTPSYSNRHPFTTVTLSPRVSRPRGVVSVDMLG
jgi:hypothetical protein